MRINEAYEHEAILPCPGEEGGLGSGCNKITTQCVDVTAPVILQPTASVGTVTVACQGAPVVCCETDPCGASCTITLTQQICVSVPVRYGVSMSAGEPTIACAEGCPSCGCRG